MFKVMWTILILAFIAPSVCDNDNRVALGSDPSSASSTASVSSSSSSSSSVSSVDPPPPSSRSSSSSSSSSCCDSSSSSSSSSDFGSSSSYNGPSLFELIFGGSNRRRNKNQQRRTGGNRRVAVANNRRAGTNQRTRNNQRVRSNKRTRGNQRAGNNQRAQNLQRAGNNQRIGNNQRAGNNQRVRINNVPSQDINPKAFFRGEIHPVNYCVTRYPGGQCWLICGGQWTRCRTQSKSAQKSTIFLKAEPAPPIPSIPSKVEPEPIQDWSDWSGWSHCSKSCGGGTKKRSRSCQRQNKGCDKDGAVSSQQIITCNTNLCPVPNSTKPAIKLPSRNSITSPQISGPVLRSKNKIGMTKQATKNNKVSAPVLRSKNKIGMTKQATKNNKAFEGGVSCSSSTVCTLAYSCQWYLEQVEQIEGLERSTEKYQEVVKELKQNVCNKEQKMICCPLLNSS